MTARALVCAGFAAVLVASPAAADPGDRDRSFGRAGEVLLEGSQDTAGAVLLDDGRIVVAGATPGRLYGQTSIGRPDRRFGVRGVVRTLPGPVRRPVDVVRSGDRLVVLGVFEGGYGLAAFGSRGRVDRSFGDGGSVVTGVPPVPYRLSLATSSDGTLVVSTGTAVLRHLPDGRLDRSYGDGGAVAGLPLDDVVSVVPRQDGSVLVGGFERSGSSSSVLLVRPDGRLDPALAVPGTPDVASGPGDDVLVLDFRYAAGAETVALTRIGLDGSSRVSVAPVPRNGELFFGDLEAVDRRGRAVLATYLGRLGRLDAAGRIDRTFGVAGSVVLPKDRSGRTDIDDVLLDPADRLLVSGRRLFGGTVEEECGYCREDVADRIALQLVRYEAGDQLVRLDAARPARSTVAVRVSCLGAAVERCRGSVRIEGRLHGRRSVLLPSGASRTIRVRVRRTRSRRPAVASVRVVDGVGRLSTNRRRMR